METNALFYVMIGVGVLGVLSKLILAFLYSRLMKDAENMSMAQTRLMKQIKLKFENCYRLNLGVKNVSVFVDKYLHKYKILGISLHRMGGIMELSMMSCIFLGIFGSVYKFFNGDKLEQAVSSFVLGVLLVIILFILDATIDVDHMQEVLMINIQDYLENNLVNRLEQGVSKEVESDIAYMKRSLEQIAAANMTGKNLSPGPVKEPERLDEDNKERGDSGNKSEAMDILDADHIISEVLKEYLS